MFTSDSTVLIPLTQEQSAIVDAIDADWINQWKWFAYKDRTGYYARRNRETINGKRGMIHMHREILSRKLGCDLEPHEQADHINGNKLDNRRVNLRVAINAQNCRNHKIRCDNSTGYPGVYFYKPNGKWVVKIGVNYKLIHIGYFQNYEDAVMARKQAEKFYFGEYRSNRDDQG